MSKIVLFYPSTAHQSNYRTFWLPYSILSVGSAISQKYDVTIVDNNCSNLGLETVVRNYVKDATIVGISSMIGNQISEAIKIANLVKSHNKDTKVVVGGAMPTMMPEVVLSHENFDIVVRGQGEYAFAEVVDSLEYGGVLKNTTGISYKRKDGTIVNNRDRTIIPRREMPRFDFSLIDVPSYIQSDTKINDRTINYIATQGCPFACGFCSDTNLFSGKYSKSSSEIILDDVESLVRDHNINGIKFYDSNFIVDSKLTWEYARGVLGRELNIRWASSVHPETFLKLDNDYLQLLKDSGCSRLLIGAESGNQEVLNLVGKNLTPQDMMKIANRAAHYDISVSFTMVVGFPEVSSSHYDETFQLGKELRKVSDKHEVKIHIYAPYPMTRLYPVAIRNGFEAPKRLESWAAYDYYQKQTPWVPNWVEDEVKQFNVQHSFAVEKT